MKIMMCGCSVIGRCLLEEMRDVWNWIISGKKIPCKLKKLRQLNEKNEGPCAVLITSSFWALYILCGQRNSEGTQLSSEGEIFCQRISKAREFPEGLCCIIELTELARRK